jgi:Rhodanese-related sulfurtransferase
MAKADFPPTGLPVISAPHLAALLDHPRLRILDATWHLDGTDPAPGFQRAHLPGAQVFDVDGIADTGSPLPHMLPTPEIFAQAVGQMGIGTGDPVVVYDQVGILSSPRVWWSFRVFGHDAIWVLDGGLPAWMAAELPVEVGPARAVKAIDFQPRFRAERVKTAQQVAEALTQGLQVLDARPAARFAGLAPEPRPGLRSGHMPGAFSLPFMEVLTEDGSLKPVEALAQTFESAGVDLNQPLITTCGSGMTAAVLTLAAARLGHDQVAVYDGSWAEWGQRSDLPATTAIEERMRRPSDHGA